ncbi:nuclear transport factor 2 family protein [Pararhizobium sp. YC-54]|uniref:nuclear transport factor 2 family protein n=1 Tax=Pararhizobium sp. YC-54 TaxID=2986920 RepID=UPI0021F6DB3A|nr:nuclear transport factor 2 family protein [Pararhizobium sp. YC-54]MCV9996954.1 nuclear transport factor 2 family protein [Pararhizobium sp. YC-54]
MTDRETLEGVVHTFYAARAVSDIAAMMALTGPDFSFRIVGSGKLAPMTQRVSEPAAIDTVVQTLVAQWDMSKLKTTRLYVDGDTVFAHRAGLIRYTPNGKEVETEYIDRFTFKDGKVVDMTEFVDTLMIADTVGLLE